MRLAIAEIDFSALSHNLNRIKQLAPASKVMAVLKANAYGHGLVAIAKRLADADAFAVARIDEALALRAGGVTKPIVLLEGFFEPQDLPIILANNFQTVIHDEAQLSALERAELDGEVATWLKVDTGMHRLGVYPSRFDEFYRRLKACPNARNEVRLMTHFSCADDVQSDKTAQQIALFNQLVGDKSEPLCLANSAGILAWPQSHGDWIRPGLLLYGVSPMSGDSAAEHDFRPVMRLKTRVIAIREVKAGECIGYGGHYCCAKDSTIAVVAMGYGDGYPRHAENGTPVVIGKQRYPIVGRVSMDMITVDLGNNPADVALGDEVIMWGPELAVEEIARYADTIPYELLCNITPRVEYQYR